MRIRDAIPREMRFFSFPLAFHPSPFGTVYNFIYSGPEKSRGIPLLAGIPCWKSRSSHLVCLVDGTYPFSDIPAPLLWWCLNRNPSSDASAKGPIRNLAVGAGMRGNLEVES